jgi:3-oxoacyl-[acyl-carrier protein] reductase
MHQPGTPHALTGKIAVVTGGSNGIGAATVAALAAQGAQLVIGYTTRIAHSDLDTLDSQLFNELLLENAGGTYSIMRAMMPLLKASGAATVVSVSSVSAFTGSGSNIAYCAAKAAIDTMTKSFARAFGPQVRFLCVSPASVDTDFVPGRAREDVLKKGEATPLGRAVTPQDVALAVLACVTHLRTATGTRVVIDGGFSL